MLHLLNTCIIPTQAGDCDVRVFTLTAEEAVRMAVDTAFTSHIGHQGTADLLTTLFGVEVPASREPWDGTGTGLVFQLQQRLPEGKILTLEEVEALPYIFREVWITPV
jgi:hypothetical protein